MSPEVTPEYADFRRRQILEAAWQSFAESGVRGTTMRGIAEAMGLSTGILYTYFRNKDELVGALQEMSAEQNRLLFTRLSKKTTVREALEELFDHILACCSEEEFRRSARANLTSWAEALQNPVFSEGFSSSHRQVMLKLTAILRRGIKRGELAKKPAPETLAEMILAVIFGVQLQVALADSIDATALVEASKDVVLGKIGWLQ